MRKFLPIILAAIFLSGCRGMGGPTAVRHPLTPPSGKATQGSIVFVPLEGMSTAYLNDLATYYRQSLGIRVTVLKPMDLNFMGSKPIYDERRHQYLSKTLLNAVLHRLAMDLQTQQVVMPEDTRVVMVFTGRDMFDEEDTWNNWVFAQSASMENNQGVAIISLYRFDPVMQGQRHNSRVVRARLKKVTTQKIGVLYYGLPRSKNPGSVMYEGTSSLDALDNVGEGF